MSLVEKEITLKNVEQARINPEFEKRQEVEQKLVPLNPSHPMWEQLKQTGVEIEQIYLSTPYDEFSLRVRSITDQNGESRYTATLKDRGEVVHTALRRTEIDTEISAETFARYQQMDLPRVQKRRASLSEGVSVDFYDDPVTPIIVEIEHNDASVRAQHIELLEAEVGYLADYTDSTAVTNEAIAHKNSPEKPSKTPESLDSFTHRVLGEMIAHYVSGKNQVVVGLTGMSGSGKTTVTKNLQAQVVELFGEQYRPIVISTDDYHFGKTALEARYGAPYTEWDSAKTYNTAELAFDLARTAEGQPIMQRHFDFDSEEPVVDGEHAASPFIIIEGLYAGSKDLQAVRDLHFELPSSVATSIGRDVRRLVIENRKNRVFPTPESRLRYQIESALPLYLELERPEKNAFSACARPLAQRAFMLERYSES